MNLLNYFIEKPVSSIIINSLIVILGLITISQLPSREYPTVIVPKFHVEVIYPNASASIIETQLTIPLEETLSGIPGLKSISSESMQNKCRIRLKFNMGVNINTALAKIRDKLSIVRGRLPDDIREPIIQPDDNDFFMAMGIVGDGFSPAELQHITNRAIANRIRAIPGISEIVVNGTTYKVIVDLDRNKMHELNIRADQISTALRTNNIALPAGRIERAFPITFDNKLSSKDDVENIILKATGTSIIKLKDIASVTLQEHDPERITKINGETAALLYLSSAQDNNIINVSEKIYILINDLKTSLPKGIAIKMLYDEANFVKQSLQNVYFTIIEAIFLVALICLLFLKRKRLVLIPLVTIPISLIGVFTLLYMLNCSINTITALALVLAIGLVVDDAIVVMENIARHNTNNISSDLAAKSGVKEVSFAIVAMTLTLVSVYMPLAFYSGVIGQIFKEFAIALSGAVVISGFVSLTLSPLMCARLLGKSTQSKHTISVRTQKFITFFLQFPKVALTLVLFFTVLTITIFFTVPKTLTPIEDRAIIGAWAQPVQHMPNEQFSLYIKQIENIIKTIPEVKIYSIEPRDYGTNTIIALKSPDKRQRSAEEIKLDLQSQLDKIPTIDVHAWNWDSGLPHMRSIRAPSSIQVAIKTFKTYHELNQVIENMLKLAKNTNEFNNPYTELALNKVSYNVKLNKNNIAILGYEPQDLATNLKLMLDEYSPINITIDDIEYPVNLKIQQELRELSEIYITNKKGIKTSIDNLLTLEKSLIPNTLLRRDQMRAGKISFAYDEAKDFSKKLQITKNILDENLPVGYSYSFIQGTKAFLSSANTLLYLSLLALIFIYSILAIQFESFIDPCIILLTIPLATFGALVALYFHDITLNIYSQIGLITLVGLITKHGVLLIDFMNKEISNGLSLIESASRATIKRLRPIIMTTATMAASAAILILSKGTGYETRQAIGVILFYGLTIGTIFTILLLPSCAVIIKSINLKFKNPAL